MKIGLNDYTITLQDELGARWTMTIQNMPSENDAIEQAEIKASIEDKNRHWEVVGAEQVKYVD